MKLYEVPRNTRVLVRDEEGNVVLRVLFDHIDGMYSYCKDDEGKVVHLAAWTEVEIEK